MSRILYNLRTQSRARIDPRLGDQRFASSTTRTYLESLSKLSLLASNRKITNLFDHSSSSSSAPKQNLNASAIPEMLTWLRRAGYTPADLCKMKHIHVAGTKGKGSVCAYATAMLKPYRTVGTYTSPHLVSPRERIAINGEPVSQDIFTKAFFEVWDRFTETAEKEGKTAAEAMGPESKPFYFRFLTILAWHIFLTQGVKDVIIECGIGGEYDATNVLPAEAVSAAVVTQLGIDHVAMLGDTVEKIAWHKAGVFKAGTKAFTRRLESQPGVMEILRIRAQEKCATLVEVEDGDVKAWGGVGASADYQKHNQALASVAVLEHLGFQTALNNLPEKMIEGLKGTKLRGRGEVIKDCQTTWCLNGAHTNDSLGEVAKWLIQDIKDDESIVLVFNQQDRDASQLLTSFIDAIKSITERQDIFSHALFTANELTKPEDVDISVQEKAAETMGWLMASCQTRVFDNVKDAVDEARRLTDGQGGKKRVLVTGSMHLVGAVMRTLEPWSLL